MLCWHTSAWLSGSRSHWRGRCRELHRLQASPWPLLLRLEQVLCPPGNGRPQCDACTTMRRLLEVPALAVPVDHLVRRGAVRLGGNPGCAIREDLDIMGEHHRDRPINTAAALRQLLVRLVATAATAARQAARAPGCRRPGPRTSSQLNSVTATMILISFLLGGWLRRRVVNFPGEPPAFVMSTCHIT